MSSTLKKFKELAVINKIIAELERALDIKDKVSVLILYHDLLT